jgi:predicted transcriptional regulator YheO
MKNLYEISEIIKDQDGDLLGAICFNYNNDEYEHEFTFVTSEKKLVSIDYGWKIPYIEEVWSEIENKLIKHSISN